MSPEQINVAIAEACGIKPRRMWRVYYDKDRQHASICIPTLGQAQDTFRRGIEDEQEYGWPNECSEPEEYDDWRDAPDFFGDLNAAVTLCDHLAKFGWRCELNNGLDGTWEATFTLFTDEGDNHYGPGDTLAMAICQAFLRTLGKWDDQ